MKLCSRTLLFLQNLKLYRILGRWLIQRRIQCCIATAEHSRSFSRVPGYEEIARDPIIHGGRGHFLIATLGRRVVGALSLLCFPRDEANTVMEPTVEALADNLPVAGSLCLFRLVLFLNPTAERRFCLECRLNADTPENKIL